MSRILSDQVALARDGVDKPDRFPQHNIVPCRLFGLAARLLSRSNCIEHVIERDGRFAEVGASRHAGWKP